MKQLWAKLNIYSSARYAIALVINAVVYLACQLYIGLLLLDFEDRYSDVEHHSESNFAWYLGTLEVHLQVLYWAAVVLSVWLAGLLPLALLF